MSSASDMYRLLRYEATRWIRILMNPRTVEQAENIYQSGMTFLRQHVVLTRICARSWELIILFACVCVHVYLHICRCAGIHIHIMCSRLFRQVEAQMACALVQETCPSMAGQAKNTRGALRKQNECSTYKNNRLIGQDSRFKQCVGCSQWGVSSPSSRNTQVQNLWSK